jgi:hypothetical protein
MNALRQRILEAMPEILQIIDNGNGGPDPADIGDFRRTIVSAIRRIAELEIMPAHQERANLDRATSHLTQARKLLEETRHYEVIDDLIMTLQASKPKASGWTVANRKRLAAMMAFDLLEICGGDKMPTGTNGGRYHRQPAVTQPWGSPAICMSSARNTSSPARPMGLSFRQ